MVPVDPTANWKYGKPIHYGEPLNFVTEHGGEQVIKLCGNGQNERWDFFNFGNEPVECEKSEDPSKSILNYKCKEDRLGWLL